MGETKNELIFLTACINPSGMAFTLLQDASLRSRQYIETIHFYLKETTLKILFVENSGVDISKYFEEYIQCKRIEILTFEGNNFDKSLGKGYGEMINIEYALKNSIFMNKANFIFKITGRCKILNINAIIKQFYDSGSKIQVLVDMQKDLAYSDSRCWAADKDFFKSLIELKSLVNDSKGFYIEHALYKLTCQRILENYNHAFLKNLPRYSGISGTTNTAYPDSWLYWFPRNIAWNIRYYLRKFKKVAFTG